LELASTTTAGISREALRAFRFRVRGEVLTPADPGYDAARHVHNLAIDRTPALIVKVQDAADVSRSVRFARTHGLPIAVRSGGHSIPGYSVNDGGLVIDMSAMNDVRIDAEQRMAWAQPGALAGAFAEEAQKHGLAVPFGDASSVGVGGITLGGGIGFLARKHGLTIDHLAAVEMVTAEGHIVVASTEEHSDLFWALRGGGGNFGVVTGFQFRMVEVGEILGGALIFPATAEVIRKYGEAALAAPEGLTTIAAVLNAPPLPFIPEEWVGKAVLGVFVCYTGDMVAGAEAIAAIRSIAEPVADVVGPMPYPALYDLTAEATVPRRATVRASFNPALDYELARTIAEYVAKAPTPFAMAQIRPLGGAMARVPADATAFSHRDAKYMIAIIDLWEEAADDNANRAWTEAFWSEIRAYGKGNYSNFLDNEGEQRIREAYSAATYERLAEIKRRYDPENVFSGNQNIRPARMSAAA
jgi:FAD/FMN-containing dehydrogenase